MKILIPQRMSMKLRCASLSTLLTMVAVLSMTHPIDIAAQVQLPTNNTLNDKNNGGSHWVEAGDDTIKKTDIPIGIYVWKIEPRFGTVRPTQPDTLPHLFPNESTTAGLKGHYNYTGNLGAPRVSRIFTDHLRSDFADPFIFGQPYDFFITQPDALYFTNTKSPITNLTYHECGNKQNGEDRVRGVFATNVNKRTGLGFKLDYLYGRGYYDSQSTAHFNGTLWGSYIGERYQLHALYSANHLKNSENGGIESDDYVTRPESFPTSYGTSDMPTRLTSTWNKLYVNTLYLTHRYAIGFHRYHDDEGHVVSVSQPTVKNKLLAGALTMGDSAQAQPPTVATTDSTVKLTPEFVPVAGFIHTLRLDHNNRRFLSNLTQNASSTSYFNDFYLPGDSANDFTKYFHIQNTLALELREGFNKWVKSGLRLFARHDFYKYTLPNEERRAVSYNENEISLGAQLLKEQGHYFHYNLLGEIRTSGTDWGEFNVAARADLNVPIAKRSEHGDTLRVNLSGGIRNERPSFYYRHYHARNAWWDNNLDKVFTANATAEIAYKRTRLAASINSIQNYTYFQETQTPYVTSDNTALAYYGIGVGQASSNIQVVVVSLNQDFKLGILNWENELTYQLSSDKTLMPLPTFSAYSNLYLLFRIAKVLRTELGGDVRFFTSYYAPTYSPLIGQYAVQDATARVKVGNYPVVNVYANFHLKNTRFYLMASHVNFSKGSGKPFLVPHYPLNRLVIRFGVSWNFFN